MNRTPSILVDTGFKAGADGTLTELDFPSVVTTLNAPNKITFSGTTLNWVPSNASTLTTVIANNLASITTSLFINYTRLNSVTLNNLTTITSPNTESSGAFKNCTQLTSVNMPSLTMITSAYNVKYIGAFYGCTGLTSISLPSLVTCNEQSHLGGTFYGCTGLTSVSLPELQSVGAGTFGRMFGECISLENITLPKIVSLPTASSNASTFYNCTGLQNVQLGSDGHPVTAIGSYTFSGCTQQGLTITVYTADGNAISGSPWGATNATIVWEEA